MASDESTRALLREIEALQSRLVALEARQAQPARSSARLRGAAMFVAVCAAAAGGFAFAASTPCANGVPFCFSANDPAVASEINANFAALKTWLEAKTGATGSLAAPSGDITTGKLVSRALAPEYATYSVSNTGAGGASIVNDNRFIRALMITGNTAASAVRQVNLYDNVDVAGRLAVTGDIVTAGTVTANGHQVTCAAGAQSFHFPFCCRMNVRTGAAQCRQAGNTSFTSWAAATTPFAAGADGHYSLSCAGAATGAGYPICCRASADGATSCVASLNGLLTSWTAVTSPW